MRVGDKIKDRLADDTRPLKTIARGAGVPYDSLRLWFRGKQRTYDVGLAERVWRFLTGKGFS